MAARVASRPSRIREERWLPYKIKYKKSPGIIELTHSGSISGEEVRKSAEECVELHLKHSAHSILIDIEDVEAAPPLAEVIKLPDIYKKGGLSRATRIAIVVPKLRSEEATAHFYVRFCRNRGWAVQKFEKRDQAISWLSRNRLS